MPTNSRRIQTCFSVSIDVLGANRTHSENQPHLVALPPALLDLKQSVTLGSAELILNVAPKPNGMVMSAGGENRQKFYLANTEEEEISGSRTHPMTNSG